MKGVVQGITAGGILIDRNRVLIIQRAAEEKYLPSFWEIPSGKKEPFEDIHTTVKREVKEEVGMDIEVVKTVNAFNYRVEKETDTRDVTQINFLVKIKGKPEVKLSPEHQKYAWITKNEIDNFNLSKEVKEAIKMSLSLI